MSRGEMSGYRYFNVMDCEGMDTNGRGSILCRGRERTNREQIENREREQRENRERERDYREAEEQ